MEGPSLYLAQEQLAAFKGKTVRVVSGNTSIDKERLLGKEVKDIFAWGKHLVFQFDEFAIRVHFLLFGTFTAHINGTSITGDYKKSREPRLSLEFDNGNINMYNCSIKLIEDKDIKGSYDFSVDIMSNQWDHNQALKNVMSYPDEEISDVLLDQTIFSGVGNIIKNEILSLVKVNPKQKIKAISKEKLIEIIAVTRSFSHQFYEWRKEFKLRVNLKIHRKTTCPHCGEKVIREKTGKRERWAYYCAKCQR
jgi:endonuclease VIII